MVLGDSFSKLLTSLASGICEVGVSSIIVGEGCCWSGIAAFSPSCSVSICQVFGSLKSLICCLCLAIWPLYMTLVHLPKIWTALGKCSLILVHWCTLVPVWNFLSPISFVG